jgi:hypothetical protein
MQQVESLVLDACGWQQVGGYSALREDAAVGIRVFTSYPAYVIQVQLCHNCQLPHTDLSERVAPDSSLITQRP